MFKSSEKQSTRIDTLIGRSARIQGDVEFSGGLHIDGQVTGSVRVAPGGTASVSVSEHGLIEGSIEAPHVVLNGTVNGDIVASERVVLGAKARVRGNVSYGEIEMALGAEITGRLIPGNAAAAQAV
jgi:cytoskeletal protein CcmA (bactofilin family)